MILYLDDNSNYNHIFFDETKLFIVENVSEYSLEKFDTHKIITNTQTSTNIVSYYFVIDLLYNEAFAHWVYESAIYLPLFNALKSSYPNIKLLLKTHKTFKRLFTDFLGIQASDVIYDIDITPVNICIFPSPISALNDKSITGTYQRLVDNFACLFANLTPIRIGNKNDYVVLPRQKKENYNANDRVYDVSVIYNILKYNNKTFNVVETDTITDLTEQINLLRMSNNVILTDGSPFLVNIMFCKHQKVFVIDRITQKQSGEYIKINFIINHICKQNNICFKYLDSPSTRYTIVNFY
jgi:hypothetical protein